MPTRVSRGRLRGLAGVLALLCLAACAGGGAGEKQGESLAAAHQDLGVCTTLSGAAAVEDATIAFSPVDPTRAVANFGSIATLGIGTVGLIQFGTLLQFDLSSIPAGSTAQSASLTLRQALQIGSGTASAHNVLAPWQSATVTWSSFASAFDPVPATTFQPSSVGPSSPLSIDLTSLAQQWLAGSLPNHGVYLQQPALGRALYGATDVSIAAFRPSLSLCYCTPLGVETCNGLDDDCDGVVDNGASCDDGNPCTADVCAGVCQNTPIPDGIAVSDGNACNGLEVCQGGQPTVTPISCNDGYACTTDSCDPVAGCVHVGGPAGGPWIAAEVSQTYGAEISDLVSDAAGNSYALGHFLGDLDLGGGVTLTSSLDIDGFYYTFDGFVMKRDALGNLLWVVTLPDSIYDAYTGGIALQGSDLYINYTTVYADYFGQYSYGNVSKLDAATGATAWSTFTVSDAVVVPGDVAVTSTGTVVTASTSYYVDFYSPVQTPYLGTALGLAPATGAHLWSRTFNGGLTLDMAAVATDSSGNTYVAGNFDALQVNGAAYTAAGSQDVFLTKLDVSGTPTWTTTAGSASNPQALGGLAADLSGGALLSVTASGPLAIAGGPSLASLGDSDVVLANVDASGSHVWSKRLGGPGAEVAGPLFVDDAGQIVTTGSYEHAADLGDGPLATDYPTGFLVRYDLSGGYLGRQEMRFLTARGLDADCAGNVYAGGTWTGDGALGVPQAPAKAAVVFRLDNTLVSKGPGYCVGPSYCDGSGCYAASSAESILHCACGVVDPTCGLGTCGGGAYCEGNGCASPQCFGPGSDVGRALCGGGVVSPGACTVQGGVKRVFVTSTLTNGAMGGLAGASAMCQSLADAAGLGGSYDAFLATTGLLPHDNVAHFDGPYVRPDGVTVSNSWSHINNLIAPINLTETAGPAPTGSISWLNVSPVAWTGYDGGTCADWTSTAAVGSTWGAVNLTALHYWYYAVIGGSCAYTAPLYCFER